MEQEWIKIGNFFENNCVQMLLNVIEYIKKRGQYERIN